LACATHTVTGAHSPLVDEIFDSTGNLAKTLNNF